MSCYAITVPEWMNSFELVMGHGHFQKRINWELEIVI